MEIRIEIVADSVDEYYDTLQRLLSGAALPAVTKNEDNVVAMPAKGRPRKAVDNTKVEEKQPDPPADDKSEEPDQAEVDELAEQIEPAPEKPKVELTNANVKALAIRYINDAVVGDAAKDPSIQDGRRKLFGEIIDATGVTDRKFSSIPDDKLQSVVEYIAEQRKVKKLAEDEVED